MTAVRPLACAFLVVTVAGCAQFPELDAAVSEEAKAAPQPELVDNRPLLEAASGGTIDDTTQTTLQSRATALEGKAAGLGGPVIPPDERQRLLEAHERLRETTALVAPDT